MPNQSKRLEIPYFEGVNAVVSKNQASKTELSHSENARIVNIGSIEKRSGQTRTEFADAGASKYYGVFDFHGRPSVETFNGGKGLYTASVGSGTTATLGYVDSTGGYQALTLAGTGIAVDPAYPFSATIAEGKLFLANYVDDTRYIKSDGTTVVVPGSVSPIVTELSETYQCPRAAKINYYKGCLYVANFNKSGIKYPNYFLKSSKPLGRLAVVQSDPTAADPRVVEVSDTRYLSVDQFIQFYRGSTEVDASSFKIVDVTETSITLNRDVNNIIKSADVLWAHNTFTGAPRFFWPRLITVEGTQITTPDCWRLAGGTEGPITMMANVNNVMMIANESNCAAYNEVLLQSFDTGAGCVSPNGYVKLLGKLYFLGNDGIYATDGGSPLLISQKVERYIRGATKAGKALCAAGKKGRSVFFPLGDVTLYRPDGSVERTLSKCCLEYNVTQEQWFPHTNWDVGMCVTFVDTLDTDRLIAIPPIGQTASRMYPWELLGSTNEGTGDTNCTDFGNAIPFLIESQDINLATYFENYNYPRNLITECERGSLAEGFVSIDQGRFYAVDGKIIKGANIQRIVGSGPDRSKPPRARSLKLSIRDSSRQICKFTRLAVDFTETEQNNPEMPSELV